MSLSPEMQDLRERIQRAIVGLREMKESGDKSLPERAHFGGKIQGLELALDYLRAYEQPDTKIPEPYSWTEFRDLGLLWAFNTCVLHPRGYALSLHFDVDGKGIGWGMMVADEGEAYDYLSNISDTERGVDIDERHRAFENFLKLCRESQ